ncbi:hypothetical protein PIN31009_00708 [Pandoraea iniqua]|uniref:DUF1045 domain-containing protein n=1 Tax=Pandoraea iniqua TaxID=2508288 RepID=UPI0012415539|nr:DUF1045 domain-containing protein [Pandoraea iniqua]VVD72899.1 hypothetical protein PIN31009_00708 [Pandoraea iniqua]
MSEVFTSVGDSLPDAHQRRAALASLDLAVARFAVYYVPPAGACWWNEGSRWLGRDAITGRQLNAPHVPGLSRALADLTVDARRYGLHGTLKAPMRLAPGATLDDLCVIARQVAARHTPFDLPLTIDVVDTDNGKRPGFVALRPKTNIAGVPGVISAAGAAAAKQIDALAFDCVEAFDGLRALPTEAELARRLAQPLTTRQRELLARWGYPYVFDEFRFHVTLTDRVGTADATAMTDWWRPRVQALGPMRVDGLALFVQPTPEAPFVIAERFTFGQNPTASAADQVGGAA